MYISDIIVTIFCFVKFIFTFNLMSFSAQKCNHQFTHCGTIIVIVIIIIIIIEELNQPNKKRDAKQDGLQHTKARLGESLRKKMEKQSIAWAVH